MVKEVQNLYLALVAAVGVIMVELVALQVIL
jgi:hypothetical protein